MSNDKNGTMKDNLKCREKGQNENFISRHVDEPSS